MTKNKTTIVVIGAGGVAGAYIQKLYPFPDTFTECHLASRRLESCQRIKDMIPDPSLVIHQVDADDSDQVVALIDKTRPSLVVNLALPYQDLSIMDACLEKNVHYIDTANYEPKDEAKFCYKWQ